MKKSSIKPGQSTLPFKPGSTSLLLILLLAITPVAFGQKVNSGRQTETADSSQIIVPVNPVSPHKRGVYKTYEEYLDDNPSIDAAFSSTQLHLTRKSDLVVAARIKFAGKRQKPIWGFSDGEFVYVRAVSGQFFQNQYWKLQCDGPRPYVYYAEKPIFFIGGMGLAVAAVAAAGSAALPPMTTMMVVEPRTKKFHQIKMIGKRKMRALLQDYPDLLEAFNNEPLMSQVLKAKYLTEYNKRKVEKS